MRRFQFRLKSILNLKEKRLEDERLKLAGILSVLEEQKNVLEEMIERKTRMEEQLDILCQDSVLDIQTLCCCRNYINQISQDIKMQLDIINKTQTELESQKLAVNEAYKDVKVLEKLKEKQHKAYMFEYEQQQIKETDDITISRAARAV